VRAPIKFNRIRSLRESFERLEGMIINKTKINEPKKAVEGDDIDCLSARRCSRVNAISAFRIVVFETSELRSKCKSDVSAIRRVQAQYDEYKDNEAAHGTKRSRRAIMQIARDTCYVRRRRCSLSNGLTVKKQRGKKHIGIGRRGTDPMSVAMLKIEGPRSSEGSKINEKRWTKGTSVVLLRTYLWFDLTAYQYRGA